MTQHWLHSQSVHSMHFLRAALPLSHPSHCWSGSRVLLWKNSCRVTRNMLLFIDRTPLAGTTHCVLQIGQRNAWPAPIWLWPRLLSRHSKQKLWRQGRTLGALNSLLQTGQWRKSLNPLFSASDVLPLTTAAIASFFKVVSTVLRVITTTRFNWWVFLALTCTGVNWIVVRALI